MTPVLSAIDFNNRDQVLQTLQAFCDNGVSAHNGTGRYLSAGNLAIAGKIVSLEARHVATIREIRQPGTAYFAGDDIVSPTTGLDVVNGLDPTQGVPNTSTPNGPLEVAQPFIVERLSAVGF